MRKIGLIRINLGILAVLSALYFFACSSGGENRREGDRIPVSSLVPEFAGLFRIDYYDGFKVLTVSQAYRGAANPQVYVLVPRGQHPPADFDHAEIIYTPVNSLVVTSTSHLPMLELIGEGHRLKGFPSLNLISSEFFRERIRRADLIDIGSESGLNKEKLIDLEPELVVGYTLGSNLDTYYDLSRLGLPVAFNAEYLEESPLGRAEWIKFMAAFFDKEAVADSVFTQIRNQYFEVRKAAQAVQKPPKVLSGVMYGDIWFAPGGRSWAAKFFADAGADYYWKDNSTEGSLELSFETVLDVAAEADYWIGIANFKSRSQLIESNPRYGLFAPYRNGQLHTYTKWLGEKGGNAYLEMGYARPDLILMDLVKILHPGILPEYETTFFEQLEY